MQLPSCPCVQLDQLSSVIKLSLTVQNNESNSAATSHAWMWIIKKRELHFIERGITRVQKFTMNIRDLNALGRPWLCSLSIYWWHHVLIGLLSKSNCSDSFCSLVVFGFSSQSCCSTLTFKHWHQFMNLAVVFSLAIIHNYYNQLITVLF